MKVKIWKIMKRRMMKKMMMMMMKKVMMMIVIEKKFIRLMIGLYLKICNEKNKKENYSKTTCTYYVC
jgi:hypothetical protein